MMRLLKEPVKPSVMVQDKAITHHNNKLAILEKILTQYEINMYTYAGEELFFFFFFFF